MIRFAWHRFRTQALVALGALVILGVVLLVTGIHLAHAYDSALAACGRQGDCGTALGFASANSTFPSQDDLSLENLLHALVFVVPYLIGMFWGAPLAAREFETGTFRLAWTQGTTRTRWLAVKLAVAGVASMATAGLLSLMVTWWDIPIQQVSLNRFAGFHSNGIAPAGYAAFAFALGVTAGLLIRRTLPAMAVTLAIVAAVTIAFPLWVRPHLIPPAHTTVPLSAAAINGFGREDANGRLFVQAAPPDLPGAWILSSQLTTPAGLPPSSEPATQACASSTSTGQTCIAYIESLHLRQTVTYQPASRYWPLQWYETAIYLALALALAGLCLWWIRPGHFAALSIRHRTSQPARALERSS